MDENENFSGSIGPSNYHFDHFAVNERNRELFCDGQLVTLTPKAFDILIVFLKNPDRLLEKDELIEKVWDSKFVEEGNLARNVSTLRKALGGDAHDHRYIVTVPGRGYRFVAEVQQGAATDAQAQETDSPFGSAETNTDPGGRHRAISIVIASIIVVLGIAAWVVYRERRPAGVDTASIRSIAVLPLRNLSGDPANDYFSDGVTESLADALSKIDGLKVISPGSTMKMRDVSDPTLVGRQLDVAAVLEGNVRKEGDSLWLAVRLVSTANGQILWADEKSEQKMKDIFGTQDEIALGVADKLRIQLSPASAEEISHRSTENTEAYERYLKGRYFANKRTNEGLNKAIDQFQQAVAADPNYALAYAGLADSYALLDSYDMLSPSIAVPAAKDAASKAIAIDDKLAEPHGTLGFLRSEYDWNWEAAEREFRTAIALDRNCAACHHWYALELADQGRFDESLKEIAVARQLDPLSLIINSNFGRILYFSRQYDKAIDQLNSTIEMDPNFWGAHYKLAEAYEAAGRESDAIEEFARSMELDNDVELAGVIRQTCSTSGYKAALQAWLNKLVERSKQRHVSPYGFAVLFARLGENERSLDWLERAADEKSSWIVNVKVVPVFDCLRNEPRYEALLGRIGLRFSV